MVFKDPEKRKEYAREYARKNKERLAENKREACRKYYHTHSEEKKLYHQENPKIKVISCWKGRGVINEDFDTLYDLYINTDKCMYCEKVFADSYERCLDHDHKTGLYRAVLCRSCNTKDILNPKL